MRADHESALVFQLSLLRKDYFRVARHPTGTKPNDASDFSLGLATVDQIIDLG